MKSSDEIQFMMNYLFSLNPKDLTLKLKAVLSFEDGQSSPILPITNKGEMHI